MAGVEGPNDVEGVYPLRVIIFFFVKCGVISCFEQQSDMIRLTHLRNGLDEAMDVGNNRSRKTSKTTISIQGRESYWWLTQ